jgi:hypothetical protein
MFARGLISLKLPAQLLAESAMIAVYFAALKSRLTVV